MKKSLLQVVTLFLLTAFACAQQLQPGREHISGAESLMGMVQTSAGYPVRVFVTKPQNGTGRLPAIFVAAWLSCDSTEAPKGPTDGFTQLLFDVAGRSGFATYRVDKPGVGESGGPKCGDGDFNTELAAYQAAFAAMKQLPFVDTSHIYVMGFSNGGGFAPLVVGDANVRGYLIFSGWYKTWLEHMLEIERRRLRLSGSAPDKVNDAMRGYADFYSLYLNGPMTPAAVLTKRPDLKPLWNDEPERQYGRPARYYQQLQSLDIASTWDAVRVPVLVIYGEYDWIMSRDDQDLIVATVNHNRPGTATLVVVPKMDHHIALYESPEKAFREEGGRYASLVAEEIRRWIASVKPALR